MLMAHGDDDDDDDAHTIKLAKHLFVASIFEKIILQLTCT